MYDFTARCAASPALSVVAPFTGSNQLRVVQPYKGDATASFPRRLGRAIGLKAFIHAETHVSPADHPASRGSKPRGYTAAQPRPAIRSSSPSACVAHRSLRSPTSDSQRVVLHARAFGWLSSRRRFTHWLGRMQFSNTSSYERSHCSNTQHDSPGGRRSRTILLRV